MPSANAWIPDPRCGPAPACPLAFCTSTAASRAGTCGRRRSSGNRGTAGRPRLSRGTAPSQGCRLCGLVRCPFLTLRKPRARYRLSSYALARSRSLTSASSCTAPSYPNHRLRHGSLLDIQFSGRAVVVRDHEVLAHGEILVADREQEDVCLLLSHSTRDLHECLLLPVAVHRPDERRVLDALHSVVLADPRDARPEAVVRHVVHHDGLHSLPPSKVRLVRLNIPAHVRSHPARLRHDDAFQLPAVAVAAWAHVRFARL